MHTLSDLTKLSDRELTRFLCSTDNDELAYTLFVERFLNDLQTECRRICQKRKLDIHIGMDIAHQTVERVRKYKSFNEDQIKIGDDRRAILVYLFRIALRLFANYHTQSHKDDIVHRTYFDDIQSAVKENIDVKVLKSKRDFSVELLKKLNSKEQRVILTDLEYKRHHIYLPDDVNEALAIELKVKKDTVRKIRERAIIKINKAIDEINQN